MPKLMTQKFWVLQYLAEWYWRRCMVVNCLN